MRVHKFHNSRIRQPPAEGGIASSGLQHGFALAISLPESSLSSNPHGLSSSKGGRLSSVLPVLGGGVIQLPSVAVGDRGIHWFSTAHLILFGALRSGLLLTAWHHLGGRGVPPPPLKTLGQIFFQAFGQSQNFLWRLRCQFV